MEIVALDKKGRIMIPKKRLEELDLAAGDRLVLEVEGGEVHLKPLGRRQVKARRRWGREAFPRSQNALLADEE